MHPAKGRGNLHELAQLDGAAKKARRGHNEWKHHRRLAKTHGKPSEVFLRFEQLQVVVQHKAKAQAQVLALDGIVLVTIRDPGLLLALRADADRGMVEIGRVPLPLARWW